MFHREEGMAHTEFCSRANKCTQSESTKNIDDLDAEQDMTSARSGTGDSHRERASMTKVNE